MTPNQQRLNKELVQEKASLWYASDDLGHRALLKAPANAIRALWRGCRLELTFGRDNHASPSIFHIGYRIYDDPEHFLTSTGTQRFREEHMALEENLAQDSITIQFHDELCASVGTATLHIAVEDRTRIRALLGSTDRLFIGEFKRRAVKSLDAFDFSLGHRKAGRGGHVIETLVVEAHLSDWKPSEHLFMLHNGASKLRVDDPNEGKTLEHQVAAVLDQMFGNDLHLSPQVPQKKVHRELTDIFAFSECGLFLIETKALNVLTRDAECTMKRKVTGLQNQIERAIDQLKGATKRIANGVPVYSKAGNEIHFDRTLLPHCIVLVSELLPFGDWNGIVLKMAKTMVAQPMYLHVIDMKDFMYFIGSARGSKYQLDYLLTQRCEHFAKHGDVLAQSKILPNDANRERPEEIREL